MERKFVYDESFFYDSITNWNTKKKKKKRTIEIVSGIIKTIVSLDDDYRSCAINAWM